jgi:5'-nucleotidase
VAKVAPFVDQSIAMIATDLNKKGSEYPLGNLIADAMRSAGKGDVAVMNNGGIRASLRAGTATYGTLFEIQPFANVLYRVTVTGASLRQYLEKLVAKRPSVHLSGAVVTYDSTATSGSRIVNLRMADGRPLRDDARYTLILNDFLATGGDGLALGASALSSEALPIVDLDALVAYLRSRPQPVVAPSDMRFIATGGTR